MEATKLLSKQHRKVESLFRQLGRKQADKEALLSELANDLVAHMAIEQELFYPEVRRVDETLIMESYEEHALAEVALKRLLATDPDAEEFMARVTALKELIQHHVKEEEEELFPKVEKKMDEATRKELAKRMQIRFDEVTEAGFASVLPRGFGKTSSDLSKRRRSQGQARKPRRAA